jgi:hypothetical protein
VIYTGRLILRVAQKDYQNFDLKSESRFDMILASMQFKFHISQVNTSVRSSVFVYIFLQSIMCTILRNRAIITQGWSKPLLQEKSVIKPMAIDFPREYTSLRDFSRLYDVCLTALLF